MPDICIDTQILFAADDAKCCQRELLLLIEAEASLTIAIEKTIVQEYDNKMRAERFGQYWLRMMAATGRTTVRAKSRILKSVVVELLDKIHFDPDDIKFLQVAISTETKTLLAEEDDYSPQVKKIMHKKHKLCICTSDEHATTLRGNNCGSAVTHGKCK